MKSKYIIAISITIIVLLLGIVAAIMWWREELGLITAIRGEQVPVALAPSTDTTLVARYYASPGKVEQRGVVLLHDYNTDQNVWNDLAAELQDENYEVMTFDFRGHGQSTGDRATFSEADYAKFIDDAAEGVRYLREIDHDMHIAIIGAGLGANVGMQLASKDTAIAAAVLVSPQYNYRGVKITKSNRTFDRPVFYLVGDKDTVASDATAGLFQASVSPIKQLREFDSKKRGSALLHTKPKARQAVIDWLNATL